MLAHVDNSDTKKWPFRMTGSLQRKKMRRPGNVEWPQRTTARCAHALVVCIVWTRRVFVEKADAVADRRGASESPCKLRATRLDVLALADRGGEGAFHAAEAVKGARRSTRFAVDDAELPRERGRRCSRHNRLQ